MPAVVAVPALVENVAFATVPVTLAPVIDDNPAPEPKYVAFILPAVTLDVTVKLPKVPTDVILGCAAVVNVPVKLVALTNVAPVKFPAPIVPVTANEVSVPTLVILGCALVVTVPAVVAVPALVENVAFATVPVTLAPVIDDNDEPFPLTLVNTPTVAPILPTLALPLTDKLVNVPTLVMLGCAAVVTVPAVVATVALPAFAE